MVCPWVFQVLWPIIDINVYKCSCTKFLDPNRIVFPPLWWTDRNAEPKTIPYHICIIWKYFPNHTFKDVCIHDMGLDPLLSDANESCAPAAGPRKSALFDVDKGRMPETELWKWQGPMSPQFSTVILELWLEPTTFLSPNSELLGVPNAFLRCPPWCWMVCPPSRGSCLPLSPIVPLLVSLWWVVCPPSRGSCLPLSTIVPLFFPFVGWCVRLPEVLSPLVSHGAPSCVLLMDGVSGFPRVLSPFVSRFTPSCFPLLDGVSAFPSFVSHSTPSCFLLLDGVSAFPRVLSPFVSHSTPSCFPLLDGVSAFLTVLSPFVSPCPPSCFPLLNGVSAFPRVLSPLVSQCAPSCFLCWMVCPPSRGSCLSLSPIAPPSCSRTVYC